MVLLQNCVDLQSGELGLCAASSEVGNKVIHVQVEGVSDVKEEQNQEPMTSSLIRTDPGVGVMSVGVSSMLHRYPQLPVCLSITLSL